MVKKIIVLLLLLLSKTLFASTSPVFLSTSNVKHTSNPMAIPDSLKRPFDVKSYKVLLDWREPFATKKPKFFGRTEITLHLTSVTPAVLLDAARMIIDSISVNGELITQVPQPDVDEHLSIPLAVKFQSVTTDIILSISYHRIDTSIFSASDTSQRGMYFFPKGTFVSKPRDRDSIFTLEDLAYTMSEPLDAHYWMPCMDLPYDKAESEISIIAPNGIT